MSGLPWLRAKTRDQGKLFVQPARDEDSFVINRAFLQSAGPAPLPWPGRSHFHSCEECKGSGLVKQKKQLKIKIPAGLEDGTSLRINGEGEAGRQGQPRGDLYIQVRVAPHPFFERKGKDLYAEVSISLTQAALGARIAVPLLNGGQEVLKIPAGVQSGEVFKIKNAGLVDIVTGAGRTFMSRSE